MTPFDSLPPAPANPTKPTGPLPSIFDRAAREYLVSELRAAGYSESSAEVTAEKIMRGDIYPGMREAAIASVTSNQKAKVPA